MAIRPPGSTPVTTIGVGMARAQQLAAAWTREDTERWLTDYPLPATFKWNGTLAYPRYTLKKGYGFWLRTAGPYHAALRGLFQLCHDILALIPEGAPMPTPEQLCELLRRWEGRHDLPWSDEDRAQIDRSKPNPAENAPTHGEPVGNPPRTHGEPNGHPTATDDAPDF